MSALDIVDDLTARLYLACVIGPARAPYGNRTNVQVTVGDAAVVIATNSNRERALYVTVSRSDINNTATDAGVIFSQSSGQASANDFAKSFRPGDSIGFVLKPSETLSMLVSRVTGPPPNTATFSVGQETY